MSVLVSAMGNSAGHLEYSLPTGRAQAAVEEVVHAAGLRDYKIRVSLGSAKGDNYSGSVHRLVVDGTDADGHSATQQFIVKCSCREPVVRGLYAYNNMFRREQFMYETVLPRLRRLQRKFGVRPNLGRCARLHWVSLADADEFIVMEDMTTAGYGMTDRRGTLDWDHCALVVTRLAVLHATSHVLKVLDAALLAEFAAELVDENWSQVRQHRLFYVQINAMIAKARNTLDPEHGDAFALERFNAFADTHVETILSFMDVNNSDEYWTITHGDCWNNNFMFKYDDVASPTKPTDICFLDWQISRWASPVLDLAYFIYNCTGTTFRTERFDDLIDLYYNTLSSAISTMGCDPETLYPRRILQEHMQTYFCFGVCMAVHTIHLFTSEADEIPDMGDIKEVNEEEMAKWHFQSKNEGLYKERMSGIIRHAVSRGFI